MYDAAIANTGDELHIKILHLTVMKNYGEGNYIKMDPQMVTFPSRLKPLLGRGFTNHLQLLVHKTSVLLVILSGFS